MTGEHCQYYRYYFYHSNFHSRLDFMTPYKRAKKAEALNYLTDLLAFVDWLLGLFVIGEMHTYFSYHFLLDHLCVQIPQMK